MSDTTKKTPLLLETKIKPIPVRVRKQIENLIGRPFGRLIVIGYLGAPNRVSTWLCQCSCGKQLYGAQSGNLKNGHTKSCGCLSAGRIGAASITHNRSSSSLYAVWNSMSQRCTNPKSMSWKDYGGRGIRVCDRWRKFENFLADMGERPSRTHSIERIDNNGNYEPSNCKWATRLEQVSNKRNNFNVTFNGREMCLAHAAKEAGLKRATVYRRITVYGLSPIDALTRPLQKRNS
jgi:hypothetical protein